MGYNKRTRSFLFVCKLGAWPDVQRYAALEGYVVQRRRLAICPFLLLRLDEQGLLLVCKVCIRQSHAPVALKHSPRELQGEGHTMRVNTAPLAEGGRLLYSSKRQTVIILKETLKLT